MAVFSNVTKSVHIITGTPYYRIIIDDVIVRFSIDIDNKNDVELVHLYTL